MALTGTLKDFGVAEILQLIGMQKKTGVLTLDDRQNRAEIDFFEGMVVGARGGVEGVSFEERLVRSRLISRADKAEVSRRAKETLKPFTSIILSEGMADPLDLKKAMALHISEIVYETFGWKSGTYAFEQTFMQWDRELVTGMSAESIMMDGLRIVDETPSVLRVIPSLGDVYVSISKLEHHKITMGAELENIFNMLDGQRTVQDVVFLSRLPRFDVLRHMAKLCSLNIITSIDPAMVRERAAAGPASYGPTKLAWVGTASVYVLLAVVTVLVALQLGRIVIRFVYPYSPSENSGSAPGLIREVQSKRIRNTLEIYRLQRGAYPDSLEKLVEMGLIKPDDIVHPQREKIQYSSDGQTYVLGEGASPSEDESRQRRDNPAGE